MSGASGCVHHDHMVSAIAKRDDIVGPLVSARCHDGQARQRARHHESRGRTLGGYFFAFLACRFSFSVF
jgi:hypothetical protein